MRRRRDKIAVYVGVAALVLLAGLALGRPELVAVAAPLAVLVVAGLVGARDPELAAEVTVDRERALVGDEVTVELRLAAATRVERLEVLLVVPRAWRAPAAPPGPGRPGPSPWPRGGAGHPGPAHLPALGRLLARRRPPAGPRPVPAVHLGAPPGPARPLKVFPVPDALRALVRPSETQVSTGSHVAAQRGDGIEFADLRPFLPGDRPRSINWRATARRGGLMVNQRHPERATDVVLFLDSFLDVRGPAGSTLDQAVGAAASLAAAYLRQRDRVGLVSFGGFVQWLQPGSGQAALYRLLDTLMETQVFATAAWKGIRHLPPRTLPAKALIVALTPLVDERGVAALFDLLARGYDLAVVDISPLTHAGVAAGEWGDLARRLWALERETLRHRYQRLGAAVVEWTDAMHLQQVLLEVEACRRRAGLAPG